MGVLCAIIFSGPPIDVDMLDPQAPCRAPVGSEPIGDDPFGELLVGQKQLGQESRGGQDIAIGPHDHVKDLAFVIDRTPQIHALFADRADHLVEVRARGGGWPFCGQVCSDLRPELDRPAPDRLVADVDPAFREQLLDIAQAEGESKIEPHRIANDIGRKPVTFE